MPNASYPKPILTPTEDQHRTFRGVTGIGGVERFRSINADFINVTELNANNITTGTLTGRTVVSSNSGNKIILNNGDYLQFYRGGTIRAQLRGNSAVKGGIVQEIGNYIVAPNQGFLSASNSALTDFFKFYCAVSGSSVTGAVAAPSSNIISFRSNAENDKITMRVGGLGRIRTTDAIGNYFWLPYVESDPLVGSGGGNANRPIRMSTLHVNVGAVLGFGQTGTVSLGAKFWDKDKIHIVGTAVRSGSGSYTPSDWNVGIESLTQSSCQVQVCHRLRPLGGSHTIRVRLLVVGHINDVTKSY